MPRLELEAALLLSRLQDIAKKALGNRIKHISLWSDSTIVLGWIKTKPQILKTFVAKSDQNSGFNGKGYMATCSY